MKTISLDLRERILAAYDAQEGPREDVAKRFRVSVGMVKKLLQQRSRTGDIAHRHRFPERKAKIPKLTFVKCSCRHCALAMWSSWITWAPTRTRRLWR